MSTTQPIRNKQQLRVLAEYHLRRGECRNHLLVVMCTHTALRISDLLRLTWGDVYDFERRRFRASVSFAEKKTGKAKTVMLNKAVVKALRHCLPAARSGDCLIKSRKGANQAISRVQAYRIIAAAAEALALGVKVSCHSLRKTFGSCSPSKVLKENKSTCLGEQFYAWKGGSSPAVVMEIYNHSHFAVTRRYLGVAQDDLDEVYRRLAEVV